ncbi:MULTISPECIES: Gfo/Idh/MocA family protein [Streptomyces]|uniref:Gfo/Idh/MocA family oxidoreductase n=1 Tax=Streptomyces mirabilis TaxID=68239 RepID=A0ABU3UI90_9ACTN|nr:MULTISPECIES: Gfo/Idh/MocA family oxidoreductase [Streptomyces]MCX4612682.1 Gfo/Idh/MocA family oxidoreductase [Streptomyces mirabilis]MCX5352909.1 Gfo/Idh/MocA family oxidoreductase [Streptomyces mirabilis]MDU8993614.1 Gfo/Idh/MocA family oxidoreductase [Streptomyces mirabilis]QDN90967.1 Gfo/Idh/MocA family oxidoreductase [Streptomyces sp. RLB3-6]QDO11797.1 Gfo/Idh/MocA family oxidoreductase [Streptomyces sp. S1D4-23]
MTPASPRRRAAVVGLGARAQLYTEALTGPHADRVDLVGLCDVNAHRMAVHNEWIAAAHPGRTPVPAYAAENFDLMLRRERVDLVVVCTVDRTHDAYIVRALEAGCDVVTEKPMTTDADRARRILDARRRTGREVRVAFNYRYNPVHSAVREILASGGIGEVGSVHFEWLLDLRHGADYFRRWHREKANSGGLMVHKSTHHFDLVNWWLGTRPETVYAQGGLFFYGDTAGGRRGLARPYTRAHGSPAARDDPFAVHLADSPALRALYLDAEHEDGYHRDQNVFGPGVTIEDDMAVLVRYASGATLTYHLTAYAPWEGYRVCFNGSEGRLELLVDESTWSRPPVRTRTSGPVMHGAAVGDGAGRTELLLRRFWEPPQEVKVPTGEGGHGGGDVRMLADLFGERTDGADPLGRAADAVDGARSLVTGLAANRSFESGLPVRAQALLDV